MWLLVKYSLLVMMQRCRHNVSRIQACLSQLGTVSCYPVSMVNFIWYADKKCSSCQHQATWEHKIRRIAIQKLNHFASGVCWRTVLLEGVKVDLSPQVCESDCFGRFCGCNSKTSTFCRQWTRWNFPSMQGSYSATVNIVCDKQVCTRGTLWPQNFITTSKECL